MLYRKRTIKLKSYAKNFCDEVRRDVNATDSPIQITTENPTITFYRGKCYAQIEDFDFETYGNTIERSREGLPQINGLYNRESGEIEIYNVTKERPENLKKDLRHECLHFLLHNSGEPYEDKDELFLLFATIYNANPYELLYDSALETKIKNILEAVTK